MRSLIMLTLATTVISCKVFAQDKYPVTSLADRFHSFNTLQVLNGTTTTSFAVNTVNGLRFGKFYGGLGLGFDYYFHVTIPLFLELRVDLVKQKGRFQLFGDGGLSFPFSSQNNKYETQPGSYRTGSLYGGGLDYLVPINKEAIILGAAFSGKRVTQLVDNYVWNPAMNSVENIPVKYEYTLNRIALRIGWMF